MDYERYIEDFNRNDERAMVERWFTDDLVVEVPGLVIRGREDWVGFLEHSHAGGVRETLRPVEVLQGDGRILAEVDITLDPALNREYGERIPVVAVDGEEAFEYVVDRQVLKDRLDRVIS